MSEITPLEAPVKAVNALPLMHPGRPVGRDDELKAVYAHLQEGKAVNIYGPSGIGKTTLAAALASAYTQQSGGVLWLNVEDSPLPELIVRVGRAYDNPDITNAENPLAMIGAVAAALTQNKPLLVLDGKPDEQAAQRFISKCADNIPVLILSEEELDGTWESVQLAPLSDTYAATLFKQKSGLNDDSSDIDVYGIVKLLGFIPYPIVIAARAMAASKQKPGDYLNALKQIAEKVGGEPHMTALTASYRALSSPLQGLLLMMGASVRGEASGELLSMVSGVSPDAVDQAMNVLSQLFLVGRFQRYDDPYYRVHEKVHVFAQAWLKGSNRLDELQEKFKNAVLDFARKHSAGIPDAYTKLATEMDTFLAVAGDAAEEGERGPANDLVVALTQAGDFVQGNGYVYELLRFRSYGSGSTNAFPAYGLEDLEDDEDFDDEDDYDFDDLEDDYDEEFDEVEFENVELDDEEDYDFDDGDEDEEALASPEDMMFSANADTGQLISIDVDQLRVALAQAKQQKDILRQIHILKAIGKVQVKQQKENEAITTFNELLAAYETTGDAEGILESLATLSELLVKTDNVQAAALHANRGIELAKTENDDDALMSLLRTLGDIRQELGESEAAMQAYNQAVDLAQEQGDEEAEAMLLYKLGFAQLDNGDADDAITMWEQALRLFKEQGKRDYEGRVHGGMGLAYGDLERWSEAIKFHNSALYIAREVNDKQEEALQLSSLGQALVEAGQLPDALLRYRQALYLAYESEDKDNIISAVVDLVQLMLRSKRLLGICELLVKDALAIDPADADILRLKERINNELMLADASGIQQAPVSGNARDYASNAYKLLEA